MTIPTVAQGLREVAPGVMEYTHPAPQMARAAHPGQFFLARHTLQGTDPFLPIPMAALPTQDGDGLRLIWERDGARTKPLETQAQLGHVEVAGPFGNGFKVHEGRQAQFVYEGIGAVTLASLKNLINAPTTLSEFGDTADFWKEVLFDDVPVGEATSNAAIYAAGTHKLLKHLLATVPAGTPMQFAFTNAPMACGVGTCIACAVTTNAGRYARVCTEGPVFDVNLFR
ncbi:hypothetical protein KQI84_08980 [bacterium]|nr:hypothetical protein [bacterium]